MSTIYFVIPYSLLGIAAFVMFATIFLMIVPQSWLPKYTPPRIRALLPVRTETIDVEIEVVSE